MSRKITQITASSDKIFALCDDGTFWELRHKTIGYLGPSKWMEIEPIPQSISTEKAKD